MKGELQMRSLLLVLAGALVLAVPAVAGGGGFATAGLGPPDSGIGVGETWNAEVTIMAHGQTPMEGLSPYVTITKGETTKRFDAVPTDRIGVYLAKVKFPSEGTWQYSVYDGYAGQTHTFKPVQIGPAGGDGGFAVPDWTWGLLAAAGALAVLFLLGRRLRPTTAPVAH
jgi:hypothetical protein